ncbi:Oxysterol-binding protein-domain-containing protein [Vararia minispora EC-137]|uniref:Oxysterol-binding protein-domain-containing protein n=1 Tax=Vararia minispora EC-137 TaxID=1314806 RepID=A0ACB8QM77_9AGAM|nr:Oxysterol-binding protein-domain-containing protein [Vararia minispora EC-137]
MQYRAAGTSEPLYQVKLLAALRSGDPALIHPFLAEISYDRRASSSDHDASAGPAALHLAIRCASAETVALLLSHRAISPNAVHPPGSGTTALHLAASLGRADVVSLLLEQEGIDDTLHDANGKTARDVVRGRDVQRILRESRSFLTVSFRSLLRAYILSPLSSSPPPALIALLSSPRARHITLSYLDDDSGTSLLHEASRRKDASLVELAVRAGADIFVRDRRGRTVQDVVGKDDKMRVFLRQFASRDTTLIEGALSNGPPELKGYLNKYTNVARGWGTRWFVLKDGVLSYYRHQEDETVASRGSIAMKSAIMRIPNTDNLRFEIHSTPSRGHTSVQKWFIRASHPVETSRWTQAIGRAIEYAKTGQGHSENDFGRLSNFSSGAPMTLHNSPHLSGSLRGDADSVASSHIQTDDDEGNSSRLLDPHGLHREREDSLAEHGDEESWDKSMEQFDAQVPPHETVFTLNASSAGAQLDLTSQLLTSLLAPGNSSARTAELEKTLKESMATVQSMFDEFVHIAKERDEWWRARLAREQKRQTMWEQSLQSVVKEGEALERELREQARAHRRSRTDGASETNHDTLRGRPSLLVHSPPALQEEGADAPLDKAAAVTTSPVPQTSSPVDEVVSSNLSTPTQDGQKRPTITPQDEAVFDVDTDEEDEFFDAIESNALPNLVVSEALTTHQLLKPAAINLDQYDGYKVPRKSLPITNDDRPPTSLWSVLKHSIGKDLTKISFPVFFNEPTSMLQRMASSPFMPAFDAAAQTRDPYLRIAFIGAFAMSNYSSTIGRIAKPFNPMLSETFEYVNLEKEYRYVSEQVSHHPPISACWAEAPRWHYYGEIDAQNKFTGRAFEIRPTGIAHANLILPAEWGPGYPSYTDRLQGDEPKVIEHFSWKKVTTCVSGFLLGQPTIDHYGEMTITNHRTNDTCVLTFKPRGWRAKDAFEISGYVADASGALRYEIAGRWNSQLVARAVGVGQEALSPDVDAGGEFVLLWRNSVKPRAPFNLTPFAITLNNCPDGLRPFIAPTDCRLRPDQRAFECGKYERANELKGKQEEHQRAIRKARERGERAAHRPRWFVAETEGDTGERVWNPIRVDGEVEYWKEREGVWAEGGKKAWKAVEQIFIEDEP